MGDKEKIEADVVDLNLRLTKLEAEFNGFKVRIEEKLDDINDTLKSRLTLANIVAGLSVISTIIAWMKH